MSSKNQRQQFLNKRLLAINSVNYSILDYLFLRLFVHALTNAELLKWESNSNNIDEQLQIY
jgi:hypothetical protein